MQEILGENARMQKDLGQDAKYFHLGVGNAKSFAFVRREPLTCSKAGGRFPSDPSQFTTKSLSKVSLAPYAVFAKLAFPPCSRAEEPTYATVQMGKNQHLNLNSDLIYINHSCDPSLVSLDASFFCGV